MCVKPGARSLIEGDFHAHFVNKAGSTKYFYTYIFLLLFCTVKKRTNEI